MSKSTEVSTWVDRSMYSAEEVEEQAIGAPKAYLLSATPDPLGAVAAASMMYEGRVIRSLSEITDDERRHYFIETFKTALKAPLEFVDLHFMIEGVTRAHTHQEVRQRTAVFAQESMRFAVKETIAARPGPLIAGDPAALKRWRAAVERIHEDYLALIAAGVPAEEARGLLPHDTLTRLHHKVNLRNLIDELGKRTCTQAQFDWRVWAFAVHQAIRSYEPTHGDDPDGGAINRWQFQFIAESPIFQPVCYATGACMFKAGMDRGCSIRARVDEGKFDEIDPREWALDPTAAWVR